MDRRGTVSQLWHHSAAWRGERMVRSRNSSFRNPQEAKLWSVDSAGYSSRANRDFGIRLPALRIPSDFSLDRL